MATRAGQLVAAYAGVSRRADIFDYPIREMQARGWIAETNDTDELEYELCRFFQAPSVAMIKNLPFCAGGSCTGILN